MKRLTWIGSAGVDGSERAMMAKVDCIYADVSKDRWLSMKE